MSEAWQKRFENSLNGMDQHQLMGLINKCYWMANAGYGDNYTDRIERDIWKAKAKMAIEKRDSLTAARRGPGMDLIRKIHEMTERGLHVTTINICGVTFVEGHEPTDEARQAVIDKFNSQCRKQGGSET